MSPRKNAAPADPAPTSPPGVLRVADIARMWRVQPGTVSAYQTQSKEMVGSKPGRYAHNPMPAPDGYTGASKKGPWWKEERRQELNDWFKGRLGLGHGTGGRRAGSKART